MEVSKSLDSIEGAVLLFDSVQGVQAQTLSVYDKAKALKKQILPALTKIDIPSSRPLEVALAVSDLFGFDPDAILKTSARARIGVKELLDSICENIPPPNSLTDDDGYMLRAKVIDSWYEPRRGVVCLVRLLSGVLSENDRISIVEPGSGRNSPKVGKDNYSVQEIGLVMPHRLRTGKLRLGQMGYVVAGLRDPREARPGSIISLQKTMSTLIGNEMELPSSVAMRHHSVLYASVHPMEGDGFDELQAAVDRLALNDTGLEIQQTSGSSNNSTGGGPFLGPGLKVGFQGLLHVEVFRERLLDEFDMEAIITPPKVSYTIRYLESKSYKRAPGLPMEEVIEDLVDWPAQGSRFKVLEPIVDVRILAPMEYAGSIMELIKRKRGAKMQNKPIDENTWLFTAAMPWQDVVTDFHDDLKSISAGYASFDVSESDPPQQEADLVKVELLLNSEIVDPLAFVCHRDVAQSQARIVCQKLQEVLPRQQFVTVIQAKADGKIIASARVKAYRKDVLTKSGKTVGGGDVTRKRKLLEKQKRGKKRQQATGKVQLSQAAFNTVISRSS
jgi:GTP-binding protein LepA